jgi:hypothetical protein
MRKDVDKVEIEVESPTLPEQTGEICFYIVDNNNNGLVDEECE